MFQRQLPVWKVVSSSGVGGTWHKHNSTGNDHGCALNNDRLNYSGPSSFTEDLNPSRLSDIIIPQLPSYGAFSAPNASVQ